MAEVVARVASRAYIASLAVATGGALPSWTISSRKIFRKVDRVLREAYHAISRR
jgi:hypothetical protein